MTETRFSDAFYERKFGILIHMTLMFVSKAPIDDEASLV